MIAIRCLLACLATGCLLSPSPAAPPPAVSSSPATPSITGRAVYYAESWGDWTCPATEHCGIAARQGVRLSPGETCIATLYQADLKRTGTLLLAGRTFRIRVCDYAAPADRARIQAQGTVAELPYPLAREIPVLLRNGWVEATLWLDQPAQTAGAHWRGRPLPLLEPLTR